LEYTQLILADLNKPMFFTGFWQASCFKASV